MIGIGEYYYDDLLTGGTDRIGPQLFFSSVKRTENEKTALELIRYGVKYYLGWSPEEAVRLFSDDTLERLRITEEVKDRIAYPPETEKDPAAKRRYLLSLLYPEAASYDPKDATEACYENALSEGRLPEGFFDGAEGRRRAEICLLYALSKAGLETTEKAFGLMGSGSAARWLREKKLKQYCDMHFSTPAEFLRSVLSQSAETDRCYAEAKARIQRRREGALRRYGRLELPEEMTGCERQ